MRFNGVMSRGVLMVVWAGCGLAAAAQVDRPTASPPRFAPFAATRPAPLRGAASRPAWGQPAGSRPAAKPVITVDADEHDFGTILPASKHCH